MPDQPYPATPEFPRFHPVPTRPVFLPDGVEPIPLPEQGRLTPTEAPALSSVPRGGWRTSGKPDASSPASQKAADLPQPMLEKIDAAAPSNAENGWHAVGPSVER
jgi:hypothetical protein